MNDLTTPNLLDTVNNTLSEILTQDSPNHLRILSWKSKKIPNALILKFQGKRYLGLPRKDKKGQEYWRYHPLTQATGLSKSDQVKKYEQSENINEQSSNNHSEQSN